MLRLLGPAASGSAFCDGISRRGLLNIGTLTALGTAGGWSLPSILQAAENSGPNPSS
jgi:hypothetical protein